MALKIVQIVIEDEVSAPEGEDWEVEIANDRSSSSVRLYYDIEEAK